MIDHSPEDGVVDLDEVKEGREEASSSHDSDSDDVLKLQKRKVEEARMQRQKLSSKCMGGTGSIINAIVKTSDVANGNEMYFRDPEKNTVKMTGIVDETKTKDYSARVAELNENLQKNLSDSDEEVNQWENNLVSNAMKSKHLLTHLSENGDVPEGGSRKMLQIKEKEEDFLNKSTLFVEFEFNNEDIDNMLQNIEDTIKTKENAQVKRDNRLEQVYLSYLLL